MSKTILFDSEARKKLQSGVDQLANAVKSTLGPKGKTVIYWRDGMYSPSATKDGVSVAREIDLKDPLENAGAQMVKEVASKTGEEAGDGTTTATVLAQAIITEGLKKVAAGANAIDIKRGIDKAVFTVVNDIRRQKINVDDKAILNIATISANNDEIIGKLIYDGMMAVGKDGVIKVQDSKGLDNEMKVMEGMEFGSGFLSPYFVNNHSKKRCDLERPAVLIMDKKISVITDKFIPILDEIIKAQVPLLIICDDMDGEALASLAINNHKGKMKVCVVRVPGYTESQKAENMEDIAAVTGATIVGDERGVFIENITLQDLGMADSVSVSHNTTTIIGGHGSLEGIQARIHNIKENIGNVKDEREKQFLQGRLARISGKVAILYIGAASDVEMGEKKDRVDDALHATRAAVEEGIVPGGGVAYIRALKALDGLKGQNKDQNDGIQIIRKAIEEPMRHIVNNSVGVSKHGFLSKFYNKGNAIVREVKRGQRGYGYNARTEEYCDLIKAGVIDPAKVSRIALQNAASVANMILTTECLVVEDKAEK